MGVYLTRWSSASQHLSVMITPLFSDSLHRFLRFEIYQIEKNVWFLLKLLYKNLVFSNLEARRLFSWKHAPVKPWQQWITQRFFFVNSKVLEMQKPTREQAHQSITATEPMFSEFLIEIVVDVEKMHKFRVPFWSHSELASTRHHIFFSVLKNVGF